MQVGWVSAVQDRRIASFRYRVEAPMAGLRARGHRVEVLDAARSDAYDVVVFSKAYGAEHLKLARAVKKRGGRVIFDICDNHFYNPFDLPRYRRAREEIAEMVSLADRVVCSTPALAAVVREETGGGLDSLVIGDVVERYKPRKRPHRSDEPLRLTWFGSHGSPNAPSGMTDLLIIREALEELAARHPVELAVCSNSREKFDQAIAPFNLPTRYVEWSLEGFSSVLAETDAAILPMDINPFTACKTHNRLTTALYAGVPVIASGIESYREFDRYCTLDAWEEGFDALLGAGDEQRRRALASRAHIDERWTMDALASRWEAALGLQTRPVEKDSIDAFRFQGRLDAVAREAVTGWVRAPLNPGMLLQVVLECDGEPVAIATADRPREDLRNAGLDAACGFSLPLPSRLTGSATSRLTVRVLESNWIVGENPILLAADEHPSFAPAQRAGRDRAPVGDQRWDVSGSISAQEKLLTALQADADRKGRARALQVKAALTASADVNSDSGASPAVSFRELIQSGADATFSS